MSDKESRRLANSQTVSQVAIVLIAALAAFLSFALDKRELGLGFWVPAIIGLSLLVLSIILGGRGIARISDPKGLFNCQAWTCLFGFFFLVLSVFLIGKPLESNVTATSTGFSKEIGKLEQRIETLDTIVKSNINTIEQNSSLISDIGKKIKVLEARVSKLERTNDIEDSSNSISNSKTKHKGRPESRNYSH